LTAYLQSDGTEIGSYDGSEFAVITEMYHDHYEGATQELHLIGEHFNGRLQSLLGLYYNDNDVWHRPARWPHWEFAIPNTGPNSGLFGPPGVGGRPQLNQPAVGYVQQWGTTVGNAAVANFSPLTFRTQDQLFHSKSGERAFFGELTIGVLEKLDLKLGFRLTEGDSSFAEYLPADAFRPLEAGTEPSGDFYAVAGVIQDTIDAPDLGSISTPKIAIAYRVNDDVFAYASYAEGFTQGAIINDFFVGTITLDPEVVDTREIGVRSDLLDNRLRFNATLFDSLWNGLLVFKIVEITPPNGQPFNVFVPTSDGVAQARGLEAEVFYLLGERWELDASLGLLDTEYLDIGDPPANGTGLQQGIPLAYAPETSYSLGVRYRLPLTTGAEVLFVGNYGWMDEYQRAAENQFQTKNPDGSNNPEPAYGVLNARVAYRAANARWELSLFGTNLTNEWYVNGGINGGTLPIHAGYDLATIGRPREVGIGLRFVLD
jgi:iron complex outermembrane receptor protein